MLKSFSWIVENSPFSFEELVLSFPWMNENLAKEQISFWIEKGFIDFENTKYKYLKSNKTSLIFLDVDGVLNHSGSNDAIDSKCLANLARIVRNTKALIILISSWKAGWNKDKNSNLMMMLII